MRIFFAVSAILTLICTSCPRAALADAGSAFVFVPAAAAAAPTLLTAVTDIKTALDKCPGWQATLLDLGASTINKLGTETADVFIAPQSGTPLKVTITFTDSNHQRIGVTTIDASSATPATLCSLLPPLGDSVDVEPLRSPNFFFILPDADTDRPFSDLLLLRLRQFGYDGQVSATNFDPSASTLSVLCASKRHALRYHVIQDNTEQKNRGSTEVTTAIGASVLKCGVATATGLESQPLDTIAAAPRTQRHYVSFGTLVSTIIAIAVAFKPKISTAQLTTAEPLVTALIDQPNTLTQANRDSVSEGFRIMLCGLKYADGTAPNLTMRTPPPPDRGSAPSPEFTVAQQLGCVGSRFSRTPTGALRLL